ncbi:hypothetical protein P7K49_028307, partial [Saguinus oedipus]
GQVSGRGDSRARAGGEGVVSRARELVCGPQGLPFGALDALAARGSAAADFSGGMRSAAG